MTEEEALKINDLYRQLDVLRAENAALKADHTNSHDGILESLEEIKSLLSVKATK